MCPLCVVTALRHGHLCVASQQIRQSARMIWGKVLDDNKPDTSIGRHVLEECFERFKASRGSQAAIRKLSERASRGITPGAASLIGISPLFGGGDGGFFRFIRSRVALTELRRSGASPAAVPSASSANGPRRQRPFR